MKLFLAMLSLVLTALLILWHPIPVVFATEILVTPRIPYGREVDTSVACADGFEGCRIWKAKNISERCREIHCVHGEEFEGDPDDDLIVCENGRACIPDGAYEIKMCATLKSGRVHCEVQ